ncbi:hypothetical protein [Bradyrhizobium sp.]|jgi:hypothetical protein|uniref:hypothetical protein n=1 Tax=Bradyrhizobium sp. TaxID=376 RepID=UPI003D0A34C9
MSAIPIHLQRRFEQRWASRFGPPVAPKKVETKATPSKSTGRPAVQQTKEKTAGVTPSPFLSGCT